MLRTPLGPRWHSTIGEARAIWHRARSLVVADLLVVVGAIGLVAGLIDITSQWTAEHQTSVRIDLSPWALPQYTLLSLGRGLTAFLISLVFTLVYGYWAAKSESAGRLLIPLLDVLQSLPVLAFLPGLLLTLDAAFPRNNVGLELAAVLMIFTGQAWNMTFSFYHSIRAVPPDMREAADVYRFSWWQRLKWVELPFATIGLVWNSMMSMAGGWFFLMINESYQLGDKDFRLPGLGSYMQVAANEGRVDAMIWAMGAMLAMIVALDQLLWRPIVVWSQRFRVEEGGQRGAMNSWVLTALQRSRLLRVFERVLHRQGSRTSAPRVGEVTGAFADAGECELKVESRASEQENTRFGHWASRAALLSVVAALVLGAVRLASLLSSVTLHDWLETWAAAGVTLLRVLAAIGAATIWTVPAGLAIGLSPRLSRVLQPVVQVCASFPAPMLFPMALAVFQFAGVSLNFGAVVLMLLGTQWYVLFNVVAGAMAIPADLDEAARSFRFSLWQRVRKLYVPAVFPYLVTGWVTAAGGAWNASIVAEYVSFRGDTLSAWGLGARISEATARRDFPQLAAGVLVMAVVVVVFNRQVWRRLYQLAERRFSLSK